MCGISETPLYVYDPRFFSLPVYSFVDKSGSEKEKHQKEAGNLEKESTKRRKTPTHTSPTALFHGFLSFFYLKISSISL